MKQLSDPIVHSQLVKQVKDNKVFDIDEYKERIKERNEQNEEERNAADKIKDNILGSLAHRRIDPEQTTKKQNDDDNISSDDCEME